MKYLLTVILFLCALNGHGATVHYALTNYNFTTATNLIKITQVSQPKVDAPFAVVGPPIWVVTVNGLGTNAIAAGDYSTTIQGYPNLSPIYFRVPAGSATYDWTALWITSTNVSAGIVAYPTTVADTRFYPRTSNPSNYLTAFTAGAALVVDTAGSDTTGTRGRSDKPFRTIGMAKTNALAGDTIFVFPGNYTNNDLLKPGVNYHFYPGVSVYYTETTASGPGLGIFDDRGAATTNVIGGYGSFYYSCGTNQTADGQASYNGNPNNLGFLVLTNANSDVRFTANEVAFGNITGANLASAFEVLNCRYCSIDVNRVIDAYPTAVTVTGFAQTSVGMGIFWIYGEMYFRANYMSYFGQQGIWADEMLAVTPGAIASIWQGQIADATNNLWCDIKFSEAGNYISEVSTNMRCWFNFGEVMTVTSAAFEIDGTGKHYINALKVQSSIPLQMGATGITNPADLQVWFTAQKMSGVGGWMNLLQGTLTADIHQFEDLGIGASDGIHVAATVGDFRIRGQRLKLRAGSTAKAVNFTTAGSKLLLEDMTMDSTNSSAATITVAANGVTLKNCTLVSSTDTITAGTAKNVGIYGNTMANRAKNANITLTPLGVFTVDSNVQ